MKTRARVAALLAVVVTVALLSGGCLFNVFQTARMLQTGDIAAVVGSGLIDLGAEGNPAWTLTPQARLEFGLSDKVNLGLHSGLMIPLSTGDPGWMGLAGDLKFSLLNDPESVSIAIGFGGGNGVHFLGWGVFGEVFLDLNVFPLYFAYQPIFPLSGDTFTVWHDVAAGLALSISDRARLLLEVDTRNLQMWSYGIGFEIGF